MWYIYILLCDQKIYYVGSTNDLKKRISQHKEGKSKYTKKFSDIELVYTEQLSSEKSARLREIQIKKWSIAKKKALIARNINKLIKLSKSREFDE